MEEKKTNINNIILAIYLAIPMVTKLIIYIFPLRNNIMILALLLIIISTMYNRKKIVIKKTFLLINLSVIILFLVSLIRVTEGEYTLYYLLNYFIYGTVGTYLMQFKYDYKIIFKYINIIFIVFNVLLVVKYIPLINESTDLDFTMDLSYSVLVGYIATLIYYKYNKGKVIKILSIISLFVSSYYLIVLNNNRGSILALVIFIIVYALQGIKKTRNRIILTILFVVISTVGINFIFDNLDKIHTDINWINRLIFQVKQNNIATDRDILYDHAIEDIDENPLLGLGIGEFENNNEGQYTHNLFLQLLCENGIIIGVIIGGYIFICFCKNVFTPNKSDKDKFVIFLLFQSIPRLMLSSVYWLNSYFWIYLYINIEGAKNEQTKNKEII